MIMKRRLVLTASVAICIATFLGFALSAQAAQCSNASVAGKWGFTSSGSVAVAPGVYLPFSGIGRFTFDATTGTIGGNQTSSLGGNIYPTGDANGVFPERLVGGLTVFSDCTARATIDVYQGSTVVRSTILDGVFVNNAAELRAIFRSVTVYQPSTAIVPTVITVEAKRLFPDQ
jgi:hypothetical protein